MIIGMTPEDEKILAEKAQKVTAQESAAVQRIGEAGPKLNAVSASVQQNGASAADCNRLGGLISGSASDLAVLAEATAWFRRAYQITPEQEAARLKGIEGIRAATDEITRPVEAECKKAGFAVPVSAPKSPAI
jgi:hypothetical protein